MLHCSPIVIRDSRPFLWQRIAGVHIITDVAGQVTYDSYTLGVGSQTASCRRAQLQDNLRNIYLRRSMNCLLRVQSALRSSSARISAHAHLQRNRCCRCFSSSRLYASCMAATAQRQYVMAEDSTCKACDVTSEEWLREAPRGAYTTSRTVGGNAVFDLTQHIDRLSSSANLMHEDDISVRFRAQCSVSS